LLFVQLAQVTRAECYPSDSGTFLAAAVAVATAALAPRPLVVVAPPASLGELDAARGEIALGEWLGTHLAGEAAKRATVRAALGFEGPAPARASVTRAAVRRAMPEPASFRNTLTALGDLPLRVLKVATVAWPVDERRAFLAAWNRLKNGDHGLDETWQWLDYVVEAAMDEDKDVTVFLGDDEEDEDLHDTIVDNCVIVSLGGGIDGIVDLLVMRGLLHGASPIKAFIYFEQCPRRSPSRRRTTRAIPPFRSSFRTRRTSSAATCLLLDAKRRAEIIPGRKSLAMLKTPSCKKHAAVVKSRYTADTSDLEEFLEAQKLLVADIVVALQAEGASAAMQPHAVGEFGSAQPHVATLIQNKLGRPTFALTRRRCPRCRYLGRLGRRSGSAPSRPTTRGAC
jgi:hypothetical protein